MVFIIRLAVLLYRFNVLFLFNCEAMWLLILSSFQNVHLKELLLLKKMKIFPKIISGASMGIHIKTLVICASSSATNMIGPLITYMFFLWVLSDILNRFPVTSLGCGRSFVYICFCSIDLLKGLIIVFNHSFILNFSILLAVVGCRCIYKTIIHLLDFRIEVFELG